MMGYRSVGLSLTKAQHFLETTTNTEIKTLKTNKQTTRQTISATKVSIQDLSTLDKQSFVVITVVVLFCFFRQPEILSFNFLKNANTQRRHYV